MPKKFLPLRWFRDAQAILLSLCFVISAYDQSRPNVLFIVCDDLNTHVSTSGYEPISTPTLESLAAESMTFTHAYCQYPVCGPSRASFLTGLYPESTGVLNNTADIRETRPNTISMPQHFKANGYWTASVGKVFHSTRHEHGDVAWDIHQRFENDELPILAKAREAFEAEHGSIELRSNRARWRERSRQVIAPLNAQTPPGHGRSGLTDEQHKDGKNARQVVNWIETKTFGDKPFFIALGIQKPHVPFLAPDKYFDLYPMEEIPFERDPADLWVSIPQMAASGRYSAFGFELGIENEALRREYMQAYHACVSFIDAQLALVFKCLKSEGLWEETIVLFTSDHGYHLGEHFLWGKVTLFDIGTRVPFIVRAPGLTKAGSSSEAIVELIDVFPTLCDLVGIDTPSFVQGRSLRPQLEEPSQNDESRYAYTVVRRRNELGHAIRNQRWRYTKWPIGEELYDLSADPRELRNLVEDPEFEEQRRQLQEELAATMNRASSQGKDD